MAECRLLKELRDTLEEFATGEKFAWQQLAGRYALLRRALWEAVTQTDASDLIPLLNECWRWLTDERIAGRVAAFCREEYPNADVDTDRLYRNACALVATAQAAVAARQVVAHAGAWVRLLQAGQEAAMRLGGPCTEGVQELACRWTDATPVVLVGHAYEALAQLGWRVVTARYWTLEWLGHPPLPTTPRLRVPVAGFDSESRRGFLADLTLVLLEGADRQLVEHPDMALRPLGKSLLDALDAAQQRQALNVCWTLMVRDADMPPSRPLDGDSLSGAATVGFAVLHAKRRYDPTCLIAARVGARDTLEHVGQEKEKLETARQQGIKRVGVATVPALQDTEINLFRERGLEVKKLQTVADAVAFASDVATGLRNYCRMVMAEPDGQGIQPAYIGERRHTELYVEPDVLKREQMTESFPLRSSSGEQGVRGEGQSVARELRSGLQIATEAQDIGEEMLHGQGHETERRVAWAQAYEHLACGQERCVVILAPPGQGKSLLTQMTARSLAEKACECLDTPQLDVDVDDLPLPIVVPLNVLANKGIHPGEDPARALRRALAAALRDMGSPEDVANYLADHAHEKRSWLFLDALDEASGDKTLEKFFTALQGWQCRVIITSRPYGYERRHLPFEVTAYRLAPFSPTQVQTFVTKWFGRDEGQAYITPMLERSPSVQQISQNPFLLTLLCWVVERRGLAAEITRAQLYDRMVRDLLGLPLKETGAAVPGLLALPPNGTGKVDEQRAEEWLPLLAEIAFTFFQESAGREAMPSGRLLTLIATSPQRPTVLALSPIQAVHLSPRQQARYLLDEVYRRRLFIPTTSSRAAYVVPHRSILEYLTAGALASPLTQTQGWHPGIVSAPQHLTTEAVWQFVDKKAWDADWEQVLLLLAGTLGHFPTPSHPHPPVRQLLTLLADEAKDDVFRHRLALAALCLPELPSAIRQAESALVDKITTTAFCLWLAHTTAGTAAAIPHIARALPALAHVNGRMQHDERPFLDCVAQLLCSEAAEVQYAAVEALGQLGSAAATPDLLAHLAELLCDGRAEVQRTAAEALGGLGSAAAADATLAGLAELLHHEQVEVQYAAAEALGRLGSAATTPARLAHLAELLHHDDWGVRAVVALVLGRLGNVAATPEILAPLIELLHDEQQYVREMAVEALGSIGNMAATPAGLTRLAELLGDESMEVQKAAAEVLGKLGSVAATPALLTRLAKLLGDKSMEVQKAAAEALGRLGSAAATPPVLTRLAELVRDGRAKVQGAAAEALGRLGSAAATPDFLARLLGWLEHGQEKGQKAAAEVLGKLGSAAATPLVLTRLAGLLRDKRAEVQRAAAEVLGKLGSAAATPLVLTRLAGLLRDKRAEVQRAAVEAVGGMGSVAATPDILACLARLPSDGEAEVQRVAAQTVGRLGSPEATPDILLACLTKWLRHDRVEVQKAAAQAVGSLGSAAVTPDIFGALAELLRCEQVEVQQAAAEAVGQLGGAAITPDILAGLAELLGHGPGELRKVAAQAAGRLGSTAATPDILAGLAELLGHGPGELRKVAAQAAAQIMGRDVRIFVGRRGKWEGRSVAELSQWQQD